MKYLIALLLSGCAQLTIKDFTACSDGGASGAVCDNYLTNHQVILDKTEWAALRFGWLCVSPGDYGNIKTELEQACSIAKCSYEQQESMEAFFLKVNNLRHP